MATPWMRPAILRTPAVVNAPLAYRRHWKDGTATDNDRSCTEAGRPCLAHPGYRTGQAHSEEDVRLSSVA